ncbi:MAG: uroporphyrinogen decarboxylase family protein [Armatimonadota bacterium]
MENSRSLLAQVCAGSRPARLPLFDVLLNEAVITHFARRPLDGTADGEVVATAVDRALDTTYRLVVPNTEGRTWTDEIGNECRSTRWGHWVIRPAFSTLEDWAGWIARDIDRCEAINIPELLVVEQQANQRENGAVLLRCRPSTALNRACYDFCGFETFSYLWADYPDLIRRWLLALRRERNHHIAMHADAGDCPLAFVFADIASHDRLVFSKTMLSEVGFFDDLAETCAACHERGLQVILHSDGYLMDVLADLLATGIDGLHPIERAAGMDIYALRRSYPTLILIGGLDTTELLRAGTRRDIRRETRRMICEVGAEGRLLIGSTGEIDETTPLDHYLAFHDEVLNG